MSSARWAVANVESTTPMQMFKRHDTGLNTQPLLNALDARPELWDQITVRQDYPGSAHHDTQCIFLRGPYEFTPESYMGNIEATDYDAMDALRAEVFNLMLSVLNRTLRATELGYVLIVRLPPGGMIDEHIDEGVYADHYARFHIALTDSPKASLTVGGETQHFAQGDVWEFNHKQPHSGRNMGSEPRIHLIFDAVVPNPLVHVPT